MVTDAWQLKDWFCGHEEILLEREERKRKSERGRERGGGGERREKVVTGFLKSELASRKMLSVTGT